MSAKGVARDHHIVPAGYLAGFTEKGTQKSWLYATDKRSGQVVRAKPRNVAFVRDFNRIDVEGLPPDALERSFGNTFEGQAIAAIRNICRDDVLAEDNDEDLNYAVNLIALLLVRNPRMRRALITARKYEANVVLDALVSNKRLFETEVALAKKSGHMRADLKANCEKTKADVLGGVHVTVSSHPCLVTELSVFPETLKRLGTRYWSLVTAAEGAIDFVTSDHPVATMFKDGRMAPGYDLPDTEITFPLDARHALLGMQGPTLARHITVDSPRVAAVNSRTVHHADRWAYSRTPLVAVLGKSGVRPLTSTTLAPTTGVI